MTIQQIVSPENIESELVKIWEALAKENKMRASLFNLIVFNRLSPRTDYIRSIVQKVVEKFPCRTLFVSQDAEAKQTYLKTAVSVVIPKVGESTVACDQIDIGVAGSDLERVPFLLLPHILPDLPVYLLWAEDPSQPHPLFSPLARLAHRIIFDSEAADNLLNFAEKLLELHAETQVDIADLNWARTEGWRDLIASTFDNPQRVAELKQISSLKISYNAQETEFFCHLKIQAVYLLSWLSSRLKWKFTSADRNLRFQFKSGAETVDASIDAAQWDKLGPGTIISVQFATKNGHHFEAARIPDLYHHVNILLSSPESCDLPYQFVLGQTATGQSLVKEICTKGTSAHYLDMLRELTLLDKDKLC
jgi:glucose-6-phosphate dehydrogenase assembly protein OpcA